MKAEAMNYIDMLSALNEKGKEQLNEKINECNNVIEDWESKFQQTKNDIKEKWNGDDTLI